LTVEFGEGAATEGRTYSSLRNTLLAQPARFNQMLAEILKTLPRK
jgi:hypothetical protein